MVSSLLALSACLYADTCPDVKGTWTGTQNVVAEVNGTVGYPAPDVASFVITTQNNCLFDIPNLNSPMLGAIRPITPNKKYAVTIHGFLSAGQNPFIIEGTFSCKKPSGSPVICNKLDALWYVSAGDPANYISEVGRFDLTKQ